MSSLSIVNSTSEDDLSCPAVLQKYFFNHRMKEKAFSHDAEFIGIVKYCLDGSNIRRNTHFKRFSAKTGALSGIFLFFLYPQIRKNTVAQRCSVQNRAYSIYIQSLHCLRSYRFHLGLRVSCSKRPNCSLLAYFQSL